MEEIETKTLYDWAWKHWGSDAQIDVLIEEMAELTQALLKSRRNGVVFSFSVIEEIADVEICMEQIRQKIAEIGSQVPLETIKRKKLIRLRNRLIADVEEKNEGIADPIMGLSRQIKCQENEKMDQPDMKTRATIRRIVEMVAKHIDPDVTVERIKIGDTDPEESRS